jgi:hypothetical protein
MDIIKKKKYTIYINFLKYYLFSIYFKFSSSPISSFWVISLINLYIFIDIFF